MPLFDTTSSDDVDIFLGDILDSMQTKSEKMKDNYILFINKKYLGKISHLASYFKRVLIVDEEEDWIVKVYIPSCVDILESYELLEKIQNKKIKSNQVIEARHKTDGEKKKRLLYYDCVNKELRNSNNVSEMNILLENEFHFVLYDYKDYIYSLMADIIHNCGKITNESLKRFYKEPVDMLTLLKQIELSSRKFDNNIKS